MDISDLKLANKYTRDQLKEIFQNNSFMRGMNKCNKTNCLVLTSDHRSGRIYGDTFKDDYTIYTGEGLRGHQQMTHNNKTLLESNQNHLPVHLFVRTDEYYTYYGLVRLAGEVYTEDEKDADGNMRKVFKFPLKRITQKEFDDQVQVNEEAELEPISIRKTDTVIGAAIMKDDEVLIIQSNNSEFKNKWVFPGWKNEDGETPEQVIQKGMKEDFNLDVAVFKQIDSSYCECKNRNINLTVFQCMIVDEEPTNLDYKHAKWIKAENLIEEDMAEADMLIAESLVDSLPDRIDDSPLLYDYFESKPVEENDKGLRRAIQDYEKAQRSKQKSGARAEDAVIRYEKDKLNNAGRPDLADQVKQVSKISSDYGYDVSSFEIIDGRGVEVHIEVKSAKLSQNFIEFFISENELKKFKNDPAYKIYCLFRNGKEYKLHIVKKNDFFANDYLVPLTYKVKIRIRI